MSKESKKGWAGSLLLHLLAAAVLFFWRFEESRTAPEFIEVTWTGVTDVRTPAPPSSLPSGTTAAPAKITQPLSGKKVVDLPERHMLEQEEPVSVTRTKKLDIAEEGSGPRLSDGSLATKDRGDVTGGKEPVAGTGSFEGSGKVTGPSGVRTEASSAGKEIGYSVQWSGGGTRKLLTGNLPSYPENANVEAQIKLEAVVLPGGKVKSLKPVQKANTKLEEAALREVRHWIFEPLPQAIPQKEQTCVITFNFRLR
jgi:outer membrane biosynthesis protein TonB